MHTDAHAPPSLPPPISPPAIPPIYRTWCDSTNYDARGETLDGPCMHGLAWWIWMLLIFGALLCVVPVCWKIRENLKMGITPGRVLGFWEATMLANHANPGQSRLKGRPMRGASPLDDLLQAQDCLCCLSLETGLVILGLLDLSRLGIHLAYAIMNIDIYGQTKGVPGADARVVGLMEEDAYPGLRRTMEELAVALVVVCGVKALLWLVMWACTLTCECINPLRALMLWAPVELLNMICLTTVASTVNRDVCLVDIAIYNATGWHEGGYVGFRRNYLQQLPDDRFAPLEARADGVLRVCEAYWLHELLFEILDTVLCFVLVVYTVYIGYSQTQRVLAGDTMVGRTSSRPPPRAVKSGVRV